MSRSFAVMIFPIELDRATYLQTNLTPARVSVRTVSTASVLVAPTSTRSVPRRGTSASTHNTDPVTSTAIHACQFMIECDRG